MNMRPILLASLLALFAIHPHALTAEQPLPNRQLELRAQALFVQVRCMVCDGQSLADSGAEVASDMRKEIRTQLQAGKSEEDILQFLVQRYGESVLMKPVWAPHTALLWTAPLWLLLIAGLILRGYFKRRAA